MMTKNNTINIAVLALMAGGLLLSGCAPLGKYKPVTEVKTDIYGEGPATAVADTNCFGDLNWDELFTDKNLKSLIQNALDNNIDLKIANEHILQAQAALKGAKLAWLPYLGIGADAAGVFSQGSSNFTYDVYGQFSWTADIFGRNATNVRGGKADLAQSRDYRQATQASLIASVANNYTALLMLKAQRMTTVRLMESWKESLLIIHALKQEGEADEVAVNQYEATYAELKGTILNLTKQIEETENNLCFLMNEPYHPIKTGSLYTLELPQRMKAGVPVKLLTGRPDVRAAQRQMESAFYTTKQAWLNFFPTLNITGNFSMTNVVNGAVVPLTWLGNAAAGFVAPIINYGQNKTKLRIAQSQQREASLLFDQTLLKAGTEVNDALTAYRASRAMAITFKKQVDCLRQARNDTEVLLRNSEYKTYLDVLTAHNSLIEAEYNFIANEASIMQNAISFYVSLGGGSQIQDPETELTKEELKEMKKAERKAEKQAKKAAK